MIGNGIESSRASRTDQHDGFCAGSASAGRVPVAIPLRETAPPPLHLPSLFAKLFVREKSRSLLLAKGGQP